MVDSVLKSLLKNMDAKEIFCLGLELDMFHNAIYEFGPDSFVGLRQAALYAFMNWATARFEEVHEW